jgi:hypothetical protein
MIVSTEPTGGNGSIALFWRVSTDYHRAVAGKFDHDIIVVRLIR